MGDLLSFVSGLLLKTGMVLLIANEIRGLILAGPVFYAMYQTGGTLMAIWIGFCSLAAIALSVIVPIFVAKKLKPFQQNRARTASLRYAHGTSANDGGLI